MRRGPSALGGSTRAGRGGAGWLPPGGGRSALGVSPRAGRGGLEAFWMGGLGAGGKPEVERILVQSGDTAGGRLHARLDSGGIASAYRFEYIAESLYLSNLAAGREGF